MHAKDWSKCDDSAKEWQIKLQNSFPHCFSHRPCTPAIVAELLALYSYEAF